MNTVPAAFPRDLEIAGVPAGRGGSAVVGNEKIDPDRLILLIGDVVEKIWNRKRECAMEIALALRHQRVGIPAWAERRALIARRGTPDLHVPLLENRRIFAVNSFTA